MQERINALLNTGWLPTAAVADADAILLEHVQAFPHVSATLKQGFVFIGWMTADEAYRTWISRQGTDIYTISPFNTLLHAVFEQNQ